MPELDPQEHLLMSDNGQRTHDAEEGMPVPSAVSA